MWRYKKLKHIFHIRKRMTPLYIPELLAKILANINEGKCYKACRLVCHMWYDTAGNHIDHYSNHLMTIIDKNPNIIANMTDTDWLYLSRNSNLTINFIEKNLQNPKIRWSALTIHKAITLEFVLQHSDKSWDWDSLYDNPNITWEIMMQHPHIFWDQRDLYYCGKMPPEVIEANIKIPWLFQVIIESESNYIPEDLVRKNIHLAWNWTSISSNSKLSWNFIYEY